MQKVKTKFNHSKGPEIMYHYWMNNVIEILTGLCPGIFSFNHIIISTFIKPISVYI